MGEANLDVLRGFCEFHFGAPCADWLRALMNRLDPQAFSAAFRAWVAEAWPGRADLVTIAGKASRRSHDRNADKGPLHLLSAFATNAKLVLGQQAVDEKAKRLGLHRGHRLQSGDRPADHRRRRRLPACGQG
ncbi:MAG: ISAs1 family transposase [Hyphomicrobiales bacterium]|nr:ISAs1 family transposase [Hyphomicrobiales bacterium]